MAMCLVLVVSGIQWVVPTILGLSVTREHGLWSLNFVLNLSLDGLAIFGRMPDLARAILRMDQLQNAQLREKNPVSSTRVVARQDRAGECAGRGVGVLRLRGGTGELESSADISGTQYGACGSDVGCTLRRGCHRGQGAARRHQATRRRLRRCAVRGSQEECRSTASAAALPTCRSEGTSREECCAEAGVNELSREDVLLVALASVPGRVGEASRSEQALPEPYDPHFRPDYN